ncbi:hypothetical protein [Botrimarina sp.]|uniref:hypothetical protein n=1 Tax=Botrimarina sp. TaxID=2795802 RepID=UPI0032EE5494
MGASEPAPERGEGRKPRTDWSAAPTVYVERAVCPHCGGAGYDRTRSVSGGDGSVTRLVHCRTCHEPYRICEEFPASGNLTTRAW